MRRTQLIKKGIRKPKEEARKKEKGRKKKKAAYNPAGGIKQSRKRTINGDGTHARCCEGRGHEAAGISRPAAAVAIVVPLGLASPAQRPPRRYAGVRRSRRPKPLGRTRFRPSSTTRPPSKARLAAGMTPAAAAAAAREHDKKLLYFAGGAIMLIAVTTAFASIAIMRAALQNVNRHRKSKSQYTLQAADLKPLGHRQDAALQYPSKLPIVAAPSAGKLRKKKAAARKAAENQRPSKKKARATTRKAKKATTVPRKIAKTAKSAGNSKKRATKPTTAAPEEKKDEDDQDDE
ncbi:hypothetical protein HPB49_025196 [Dermacentor silvarum]|uniref:Uncharacterized protein n=1 Tax=Dermacentor silvarum TaxID=543639 RepID=A0ACB8C683_DERSI|nr:hypothetical protein HPB49_025196 [Dermacentor silvarum]